MEERSFFGGKESNLFPEVHASTVPGDGGDKVDAELGDPSGFSFSVVSPLADLLSEKIGVSALVVAT